MNCVLLARQFKVDPAFFYRKKNIIQVLAIIDVLAVERWLQDDARKKQEKRVKKEKNAQPRHTLRTHL